MIKPTRYRICASAFVAVAFAHAGFAQGFGSSVFSDGGGLLLEPSNQISPVPGTLNAPAAGGGDDAIQGPGGAQTDTPGGRLVTLGLSAGYNYEDEQDELTESYFNLGLQAGVLSETRNQTFDLNFGVDLRVDDRGTELVDPLTSLDYTLQNRHILVGTNLIWRESDVADTFIPSDFDGDDLIIDGGTEETHEARFRLETGRAARFGTTSRFEYRQIDFTDVTDPGLVNEIRYLAETELRFSLDRRVELTTFARWDQTDEDDAVETVETNLRYGAGVDVLIDPALTGSLDVAWTDQETETIAGVVEEDGFDLTARLTRFMPNGQLTFSFVHQDLAEEAVSTIDLARALTLANGAQLSGGIGLAAFEGGDIYPLVSLSYAREILRGQTLSLSLEQTAGVDENSIRTTFNVDYNRELTRNSRLGINGALAGVDEVDTGIDTLAASIGISYTHDLTEDWALVARANSRLTFEDGDQTDQVNRVSINLERTFSFRP